jgi:hypothetical protein
VCVYNIYIYILYVHIRMYYQYQRHLLYMKDLDISALFSEMSNELQEMSDSRTGILLLLVSLILLKLLDMSNLFCDISNLFCDMSSRCS